MGKAFDRLKEGLEEVLSITKGDQPAASITVKGHVYVPKAELDEVLKDKERLDWLRDESWDLRCFSIPTGGDDADIGWRVVGHWMAKPHERTVGEVYTDNPRAAIDAAIANAMAGNEYV